jgi:serine phosphatase RsbU (regulator of sigma subunit)
LQSQQTQSLALELKNTSNLQISQTLQRKLSGNNQWAAIGVFEENASLTKTKSWQFLPDKNNPHLGSQNPEVTNDLMYRQANAWIAMLKKEQSSKKSFIKTFSNTIKLPVFAIATTFNTGNTQNWLIIFVWQQSINAIMQKTKSTQSLIFDDQGQIFASSHDSDILLMRNITNQPLVKTVLESNSHAGYKSYKDKTGKLWGGSYVRLSDHGLNVLLEQDIFSTISIKEKIYDRTLLWGGVFALVAIGIAFFLSSNITEALTSNSTNLQKTMFALVEQTKIEKELETHITVKNILFPENIVKSDMLEIRSHYFPCMQYGGDWWGHFNTDSTSYIFIADMMGHGVPTALLSSMVHASCQTLVAMTPEPSLTHILAHLNNLLLKYSSQNVSMSMFALAVDLKQGTITYANAGHEFPIFIPHNDQDERAHDVGLLRLKTSHINLGSLQMRSTPLGIRADAIYEQKQIDLRAGDRILLYSNGLINSTSPEGRSWGRKSLIETVSLLKNTDAEQFTQLIAAQAMNHFNNQSLKDDITLVCVSISDLWAPHKPGIFEDKEQTKKSA